MSDGIKLPGTESEPGGEESNGDGVEKAPRLETLAGKKLAFVDWGKPNGDRLYEKLKPVLENEYSVKEFDYYKKPSPSSPIPRDTFNEIVEAETDAVILAIADCGSCNSSVVVDAIDLEQEDIPPVQVITDKFLDLNKK